MTRLLSPILLALILSFTAHTAFAQDVITDTVTIPIDGITRTLTVTFTTTGVAAVDVAPISDTFKVTATQWLSALWTIIDPIHPDADVLNLGGVNAQFDVLLSATESTTYPAYYTPFVRQFRFAVHACRNFAYNHNWAREPANSELGIFLKAPYFTLLVACHNRYYDAYVEMERIAHPLR